MDQSQAALVGGVLGGGVGAVAGNLFGGKKRTPSYNIQPLPDQINASTGQQKQIATNLYASQQPLLNQYKTATDANIANYTTSANQASKDFLTSLGKNQNLQGQQLSDVLQQRILGALPQQQAALREGLAGTGGLERGSAAGAMENLSTEAAQQIGQGEQAIMTSQLAAQQQALGQVYNMDEQTIQNATGMSKDEILQLYNSGNTDLINEANSLLGIEQTSEQNTLDALAAQATGNFSAAEADQAQQQAFINSLLQAGGTLGAAGISAATKKTA